MTMMMFVFGFGRVEFVVHIAAVVVVAFAGDAVAEPVAFAVDVVAVLSHRRTAVAVALWQLDHSMLVAC